MVSSLAPPCGGDVFLPCKVLVVIFSEYILIGPKEKGPPRERAREVKTFSRLRIFLVEEENAQLSVLLFRSVRLAA